MNKFHYDFNSKAAEIHWHPSLASTNDTAKELAESGSSEGTSVIADEQTSGRGRHGRSWHSPSGQALYLSLILRPNVEAEKLQLITLSAAVAATETGKQFTGGATALDIKWPNDVLVNSKKVCGILVESAFESSKVKYAILGIGFNLNQTAFPDEIADSATSLRVVSGRDFDRREFALALLNSLGEWYSKIARGQAAAVINRWCQLSSYATGKSVIVDPGQRNLRGVTCGLTETGALLLRANDGNLTAINAGEIVNLRT
jgi:BirA family biotin operon repressor/biotin-[acetyl-CoA-carboxylase] ligase